MTLDEAKAADVYRDTAGKLAQRVAELERTLARYERHDPGQSGGGAGDGSRGPGGFDVERIFG